MPIKKPVAVGSSGFLEEFGIADSERLNVALIGAYDGVNQDFLLPEPAMYAPPRYVVRVYHNGRRLWSGEYQLLESVPGGGLDSIRVIFAPATPSKLFADYVAA
jgi:hypothetical protein